MTTRFFALALSLLTASVVSPRLMADEPTYNCPEASLGETAADCPWAGLARELSDAPAGTDLANLLKKEQPDLDRQLHELRGEKSWVELWGYSINFDELAHGIIVDPKIMATLYGISK